MPTPSPTLSDMDIAIKILLETAAASNQLKVLNAGLASTNKELVKLNQQQNISNRLLAMMAVNSRKAASGTKELEKSSGRATKGLFSMTNVLRTALGTLEAMAIFLITRFVGQAINKTIDSLRQLELAFYKISLAEKSLSKAGIEITQQDLLAIASEIQRVYGFVSKIDALKMASDIAILTKDLKLSKEQILELAKAIPVLALQAGVSIESATEQVVNGITKSGRGWADLGIQVDAAVIRENAINKGLVESAEAYDALSAEQKQQVEVMSLISILQDSTIEGQKEQNKLNDTATGQTRLLTKAWEDFTTEAGVRGAPIIVNSLKFIIVVIEKLGDALITLRYGFAGMVGGIVISMAVVQELIKGNIKSFKELIEVASIAGGTAFSEVLRMTEYKSPGEDTPTGKIPLSTGEDESNIADALKKMEEEILESQIKFSQDMQDVAIDLGRKMVDITSEYARKRADAFDDYDDKVRDINRDADRDIQELEAKQKETRDKAREDELQKELEFQNKLQEMKENFLMDLDDALHERNARQILRLIKQYNLEKLQAERKHALDKQNDEADKKLQEQTFARERQDAEKKRQQKLADAQQDYQDKLAKLKADEDAEVQAAVLAANRKIQDLEKNNADRLALVGAGLVNEFNLTAQGLEAIVGLYRKYYSDVSSIYSAMMAMMGGMGNVGQDMTDAQLRESLSKQYGAPIDLAGGRPSQNSRRHGGEQFSFARGGTMFADKPTTVTFGEVPEMATFTPIGGGSDVGKVFSNMSGEGGGGKVSIELLLSPDLESRIVRSTLNKTAEVITKVSRSK